MSALRESGRGVCSEPSDSAAGARPAAAKAQLVAIEDLLAQTAAPQWLEEQVRRPQRPLTTDHPLTSNGPEGLPLDCPTDARDRWKLATWSLLRAFFGTARPIIPSLRPA